MALIQLVIILVAFVILGGAIFFVVGLTIFNKKEKKSLRTINLQVLGAEYYGADFKLTESDLLKKIALIENNDEKVDAVAVEKIGTFHYRGHRVTVFEFVFKPDLDFSLSHLTGILVHCENRNFPTFRLEKNGVFDRIGFNDGENAAQYKLPNLGGKLLSVYADPPYVDATVEFLKDKKQLIDLVWVGIEFYELYANGQHILFYGEGLFEEESGYFDKVERVVKKMIQLFCEDE